MDFNTETRKRQIDSLKQYIIFSRNHIDGILSSLGWSATKTIDSEPQKIICPINTQHLISHQTASEHIEKCKLSCEGYDIKNEIFLSEPPERMDSSTIKLDNVKKIEILTTAKNSNSSFKAVWNGKENPMTSDRLTSSFSNDEKLALYDYCIKHTKGPPTPQEFTLELPELICNKSELSEREKLSLARNLKRRSLKYKSIHTNKKNQTEIMREVINGQMELYCQWLTQKQKDEERRKEKIKSNHQYYEYSREENDYYYHQANAYHQNKQIDMRNYTSERQYNNYYESNTVAQNGGNGNEDGVILDWSHLYQGGVETDIYADSDQFHYEHDNHEGDEDNLTYSHLK